MKLKDVFGTNGSGSSEYKAILASVVVNFLFVLVSKGLEKAGIVLSPAEIVSFLIANSGSAGVYAYGRSQIKSAIARAPEAFDVGLGTEPDDFNDLTKTQAHKL